MPRVKVKLDVRQQTLTIFNLYEQTLYSQVTKNTFNNYIRTVKNFLNFYKEKQILDINKVDILGFVIQKVNNNRSTKKTAKRHFSAIKSFFKFLKENDYIETDYSSLINTKSLRLRGKELPKDIPLEYIESFLSNCRSKEEKIISSLIFNTGCRNIEASSIQTDNIDFEMNVIKLTNIEVIKSGKILFRFIPKSGHERLLYLTKGFSLKLKQYVENVRPSKIAKPGYEKFLFICDKGNNFTDQRIREFFREVREIVANQLNLTKDQEEKIIPHSLRHTLGSELGKKEVGLKQISDQLGHQSIESTLIYTGNLPIKITKNVEKNHPME